MFHADLHIHSKFSRACSRDCDIEHLAWWALRKGITVVGTGDFTHPAWGVELRESLIPAEPGLLRLRPDLQERLRRSSPASCQGEVRFLLSAEISTIYRRDDRTRKVHHLLYAPSFEAAGRITEALAKIGNLASDGRPIIGLDSRDLLEITLNGGTGCYLIPAHVWTPWFAVLGSKSGFDLVADCYADLASEVFAIETGLSSDPPMNWMCSSLDSYQLVSNSDAHSPPMLGREATTLSCDLDYFAMADAFRTGKGLAGTLEFFPEEGRYHLDGHRKCGVRLAPEGSDEQAGICPACGKPLTIGVLHRVADLADRPAGYRPPGAPAFANLIQLRQIVAEIVNTGPASKKVEAEVSRLVGALGPELGILRDVPVGEIQRAGGTVLAEAVTRLRQGAVMREAGYDGEYGTVSLFAPGELAGADTLFDLPAAPAPAARAALTDPGGAPGAGLSVPRPRKAARPDPILPGPAGQDGRAEPGGGPAVPGPRNAPEPDGAAAQPAAGDPLLGQLDPDQRAAAVADSPLMIVAGPGTGKTRTLTYRLAWQLVASGRPASSCLAVTFTRRAAEELRTRLAALDPALTEVTVTTFHGLGLLILRELPAEAGLPADFEVADEAAVQEIAAELAGSAQAGRELLTAASADEAARESLVRELARRGLVDFDGLIELTVAVLAAAPEEVQRLRERWPMICVDEYQDIDARQYELLRLLAGSGTGLTAIGDPDQAIYGFRGGDVRFFLRFGQDYPQAATRQLRISYRSSRAIVAAASAAVAPATLVPGRELQAVSAGPPVSGHETADEHAEAAWICVQIDELLGGSSFHSLDSGRVTSDGHAGLSLADIAVLYRTDTQSGALGQALTRAGLPFRKGGHDLLQRRTGVPEIMAELEHAAPGPAVADLLRAAVAAVTARHPAREAVDTLAAGELLAPLARRCGHDLDQFRTEVSLGATVDALDPRADAITLLTLHAAKGLEYEVVFLAGCEYGLLPLRLPGRELTQSEAAEERRLLFVGMTRARTRLFLSYAATRTRRGVSAAAGPSPFLRSIGPDLLTRPGQVRPRRPAQRQLRLL
jgi:DNA helicase II / ATP-dependent DNA helicase PcrA